MHPVLEFVKKRRVRASPNKGFIQKLLIFEESVIPEYYGEEWQGYEDIG